MDGAVLELADPKPPVLPPNEKLAPPVLSVSFDGSAFVISLVGLSSMRIPSSSFLGGVEGRAGAGAPNENGLGASVAAGAAVDGPKLNGAGAAGA